MNVLYSLQSVHSAAEQSASDVRRELIVADQAGIVEDAGLHSRTKGLVGQSS
jgi:hypothetical protein